LLGEVTLGDCGRHLDDVANLAGEVGGHVVDVVGEVLPRAGDALDLGLPAELALGAHLSRDPGHLVGQRRELGNQKGAGCGAVACSPVVSRVIFWDRSPRATAVVTWAMLRTWLVRLAAMKLTLSVRSFHVPDTPFTSAWPPSLPSVPTSLATRVTSSANDESWSTMVLKVFFSSRISPLTSTVIFCDRSPLATA